MNTLNPGYKFLTLFILSMILSFTYRIDLNLIIFFLCFAAVLLTPAASKRKLFLGLIPFVLTAAGFFFAGLFFSAESEALTGSWGSAAVAVNSYTSALQLSTRILAFGGIGILFALTTDSAEFIMSLMQQFHLPPKFAYGLLASYHFVPVIRQEYQIVRASLKVRGIKAGPLSTKQMIPMLVHAFERSESIAMAMESRGFCPESPRRTAFPIAVKAKDYCFLFISVSALLLFLLFSS